MTFEYQDMVLEYYDNVMMCHYIDKHAIFYRILYIRLVGL